uniref:Nonstructural protein n=1 Tax=Physostegia virginiana fijivirus TaxID=3075966 RepID=A0AA96C2T4_9REOV|nr:nonstructural protein [Physostegia virginiana fijivirus]
MSRQFGAYTIKEFFQNNQTNQRNNRNNESNFGSQQKKYSLDSGIYELLRELAMGKQFDESIYSGYNYDNYLEISSEFNAASNVLRNRILTVPVAANFNDIKCNNITIDVLNMELIYSIDDPESQDEDGQITDEIDIRVKLISRNRAGDRIEAQKQDDDAVFTLFRTYIREMILYMGSSTHPSDGSVNFSGYKNLLALVIKQQSYDNDYPNPYLYTLLSFYTSSVEIMRHIFSFQLSVSDEIKELIRVKHLFTTFTDSSENVVTKMIKINGWEMNIRNQTLYYRAPKTSNVVNAINSNFSAIRLD